MVSCVNEEFIPNEPDDEIPPVKSDKTDQTVFMYMPWSTDLTSYFHNNIADLEKAVKKNILKNERFLVFLSTSSTEAILFELRYYKGQCIRDTLKSFTDPALTTSTWITSLLNDVKDFSPANRYSMIISCHGLGWIPVSSYYMRSSGEKYHWEYEGGLKTRFFGGLTSEYQTDITTLAEGITNAGIKMEYIMFDDCYMSTIEVAYDLKEVTNYLIASPTEVMAHGFPYDIIGEHLVGDVDYAGISNGFYNFYTNYEAMPCGTIGVTDCSELDDLASVMKEINQQFTFDPDLISSVQRLDGYYPIIFFDFGDYVSKLCTDNTLLTKFEEQLERAVPSIYRKHTPYYYSMSGGKIAINAYSGITISDPSTNSRTSPKTQTAWYQATH